MEQYTPQEREINDLYTFFLRSSHLSNLDQDGYDYLSIIMSDEARIEVT